MAKGAIKLKINGVWVAIRTLIGPRGPQGDQGDRGEKGETGDSGVHIGDEAPTDPAKNVWVVPNAGRDVEFNRSVASANADLLDGLRDLETSDDPAAVKQAFNELLRRLRGLSLCAAAAFGIAASAFGITPSTIMDKVSGEMTAGDMIQQGEKPRRYAMFVIPLNYSAFATNMGHYTQFELKASTNNFTASASQHDRCCFYSHSGHADGFFSTNDKMRLYLNHGGADQRSYVRIPNTLDGMPDYSPSEVVVIVDPAMMNPDRSDGTWLSDKDENIMWTWVRTKDGERETDADTDHCLWRPIAPVRWFHSLPNWAD